MPPPHTNTTGPTSSRPRTKLTRVVVVPASGGAAQEFWADEFDLSYQDGGRTLKLLATGTPEQAQQALAERTASLAGDFCDTIDALTQEN